MKEAVTIFNIKNKLKKINFVLHDNVYTIDWNGTPIKYHVSEWKELWRASFSGKEPITQKWIDGLKKNDVLWDVGANVGIFSLYAGKRIGCRVYSFEPVYHNFNTLNRNIILNNLGDNVSAFCISLHEKIDIDYIYLASISSGSSQSNFKNEDKSRYAQGSIGISIDELVKYIEFPTNIKIDVDGNEELIINGAKKTLKDKRLKSVMIEVNSNDQQKYIDFFKDKGLILEDTEFESEIDGIESRNHLFVREK